MYKIPFIFLISAIISIDLSYSQPAFVSSPSTTVLVDANYEYAIKLDQGFLTALSADSLPGWLSMNSPKGAFVKTLAGSVRGYINGLGSNAKFYFPSGIDVDQSGNIYVSDYNNHCIRKITPEGLVSTLAGSGTSGSANGTGIAAQFFNPRGLAVDRVGNVYVADFGNNRIRKITPGGVVSTLAGSYAGFGDGIGNSIRFNDPFDVAVDTVGNVFVADMGNQRIRKLSKSGVASTVAGSIAGYADGRSLTARFDYPQGLAVDKKGNIFVADSRNHRIRKIDALGEVSTVAGSGMGFADGLSASAQFSYPNGIEITPSGTIYVADYNNHRIRKISPAGFVSTLAGSTLGTANGPGILAQFNYPSCLAVNSEGVIYIADNYNFRICEIIDSIAVLRGTPGINDIGVHKVMLNAIDGTLKGAQEFEISVKGEASFHMPDLVFAFEDKNVALSDPVSTNKQGTFTFEISDTTILSITGKNLKIKSDGIATITVTQAANGLYLETVKTFNVRILPPSIIAGMGRVLSLEGNNHESVEIPDKLSLDFKRESFSIEFWLKRSAINVSEHIVSKFEPLSGKGWRLSFETDSLIFSDGGCRIGTIINDTLWHHFAGVRDVAGKYLKLFVDGHPVSIGSFTAASELSNSSALRIGYHMNLEMPFSGSIDELRVWSVAKEESRIREYMNTPISGTEPDLRGYWNFEDIEDLAINDNSENGNNGLLKNPGANPEWCTGKIALKSGIEINTSRVIRLGGTDLSEQSGPTALILTLPSYGKLFQTDDSSTKGTEITSSGSLLTDPQGNPCRILYEPLPNFKGRDSLEYKLVSRSGVLSSNSQKIILEIKSSRPVVETSAAGEILSDKLNLGGCLISDGGEEITRRGIVWSNRMNPDTSDNIIVSNTKEICFSQEAVLPPGMVVHYRSFAENAKGISYGDDREVSLPAAGFGTALHLMGNGEHVVLPATNLKGNSLLSVAAWVKIQDFSLNSEQIILSQTLAGSLLPCLSLSFTDFGRNISFGLATNGVFMKLNVSVDAASFLNKWHYVVATFDGSSKRIYVDGLEIGSIGQHGLIDDGAEEILLGSIAATQGSFEGYLDEVSVWNKALSPIDVQNSMYGSTRGDEHGLEALLKFNENSGQQVYDSGPTKRNGTFLGASEAKRVNSDILDFRINEDEEYVGRLPGIDATGNSISYFLRRQGNLGNVSFGDTVKGLYKYVPELNASGIDTFSYKVSNGSARTSEARVKVTIEPVNDPPLFTYPVSSMTYPGQVYLSVKEKQCDIITVMANDPDNTKLFYSISGGSNADLFSISSDGRLSFVAPPDFEHPLDSTKSNSYKVKLQVSDGSLITSLTCIINVIDVDDTPPQIPSALTVQSGDSQNTVKWKSNTEDDISTYSIYAGTDYSTLNKVATIGGDTCTFIHRGLSNGILYYYRISSTDTIGNVSLMSEIVIARPRGIQFITFDLLPEMTYGDEAVWPSAFSNSSLTVQYESSNPAVASIIDDKIHIIGAGESIITARQQGDSTYQEAPSISRILRVKRKVLIPEAISLSKIYDGTTNAQIRFLPIKGIQDGDDLSITYKSALFTNPDAGLEKEVIIREMTVEGISNDNYEIAKSDDTIPGSIQPKELNLQINHSIPIAKVYDANCTANLPTANYYLSGIESRDTVSVLLDASYCDKYVGSGKDIRIDAIRLEGPQRVNYFINDCLEVLKGDILKKEIKFNLNADTLSKIYDGTTMVTVDDENYHLNGVHYNDTIQVKFRSSFTDKNVGFSKNVLLSDFALEGPDRENYLINIGSLTTTGSIYPKEVSITFDSISGVSKEYDGSRTAFLKEENFKIFGILPSDKLNLKFNGTYADKNAGIDKIVHINDVILLAADKDNYVLKNPLRTCFGTIRPKPLRILADNKQRLRNTANPPLTLSYIGFIPEENESFLIQAPLVSTSANSRSPTGLYPISVYGGLSENYEFIYIAGSLEVLPDRSKQVLATFADLFENSSSGTLVGTLNSVVDDDSEDINFQLVLNEEDNEMFTIAGNKILTAVSLDFEQKPTYKLLVRATSESGWKLDTLLSVQVKDVNDPPSFNNIPDQQVCASSMVHRIAIDGITAGQEPNQVVSLSASSTNPDFFENSMVTPVSNESAELIYTLRKNVSGSALVTIDATDNGGVENNGIDKVSKSFLIKALDLPVLLISSDSGESISKGQTVVLTASGEGVFSWKDAPGILSGQNSPILSVRPSETTTYKVSLMNSNSCISEQQITINVLSDYRLVNAMNIITPNGDGINDRLRIQNLDMYPQNEVKIFDRAGRLLFSQRNYSDQWDGTINGTVLNEDTYYYIVDFGPGIEKIKGFVSLIH